MRLFNPPSLMPSSLLPASTAALLWAAAAGGAVLWWLHKPHAFEPQAPAAMTNSFVSINQRQANVLNVLGGVATSEQHQDFEKQFELIGVIARAAGQGSALIKIKGQVEPKVYRVGDTVGDQWTVQTVTTRSVALQARDGVFIKLELPKTD